MMNRRMKGLGLAAATAVAALIGTSAGAENDGQVFRASLIGYEEVPAVSTTGHGRFRAHVNGNDDAITYELQYAAMEGTVSAAHIHLGQKDVNGGVSAFLCGGGGKPACPATAGSVSGTIVAADVIGPGGQGIAPGELSELLQAMRSGVTYANVHTDRQPGGAIRGQIRGPRSSSH